MSINSILGTAMMETLEWRTQTDQQTSLALMALADACLPYEAQVDQDTPVYWMDDKPEVCEFCSTPIKNRFYDARIGVKTARGYHVTRSIIAGFACPSCFTLEGIGLGLGKGQEYTKQPDGKWLKTGG